MTSHGLRAVLFDLDGTLVDTLQDIAHALNGALAAAGLPTWPLAEYRELVGEGARRLVEKALPADQQPRAEPLLRDFLRRYDEQLLVHTRPYPGVPELLEALSGRGLRLAVLSNKPHPLTVRVVEGLLPRARFAAVVGQREGVPRKPDPTAALRLADELGVPPAAWAYVGDTRTDMQTAVGAGMLPVGVLWGYRGREELLAAGARRLAATPDELADELARLLSAGPGYDA